MQEEKENKKMKTEKEGEGGDKAKKDKKKEREKPFTVKDFVGSKFGLPLLEAAESGFRRKCENITENATESEQYTYLRRVCRFYLSWIQASPVCGNKRTRGYHVLKKVQEVINSEQKPEKGALKKEEDQDSEEESEKDAEKRKYMNKLYGETIFGEDTLNTDSFSMLTPSVTDIYTETAEETTMQNITEDITEDVSQNIADNSSTTSEEIMIRRRVRKRR